MPWTHTFISVSSYASVFTRKHLKAMKNRIYRLLQTKPNLYDIGEELENACNTLSVNPHTSNTGHSLLMCKLVGLN